MRHLSVLKGSVIIYVDVGKEKRRGSRLFQVRQRGEAKPFIKTMPEDKLIAIGERVASTNGESESDSDYH